MHSCKHVQVVYYDTNSIFNAVTMIMIYCDLQNTGIILWSIVLPLPVLYKIVRSWVACNVPSIFASSLRIPHSSNRNPRDIITLLVLVLTGSTVLYICEPETHLPGSFLQEATRKFRTGSFLHLATNAHRLTFYILATLSVYWSALVIIQSYNKTQTKFNGDSKTLQIIIIQ